MEEYYYSGSGFYDEEDANISSAFTDVSELPCSHPDRVQYMARRYGQWWTLTAIAPTCANHIKAQEQLRLEYARLLTLHHPHITRVVAMVDVPWLDDECVVEEHVDGQTLSLFMQSNPSEKNRYEVLSQIVDALHYCHSKGIAHGHLSADSVLVTHQSAQARLVNFDCCDDFQADLLSMATIIDILQLPKLKRVASDCRNGAIRTADALQKAIEHKTRLGRRWIIPVVVTVAVVTLLVSFWAGYRTTFVESSLPPDSLQLKGLYFSDTVRLSQADGLQHFYSTLTGANIYYCDWRGAQRTEIAESKAVDLGLSVLWAPFNVGCTDADVNHVGAYYLWCDTTLAGAFHQLDEYWPQTQPMADIAGTRHDPARQQWGGDWRMPSHDEFIELRDKCVWSLVRYRGLPLGYKVKGANGASIYLPLAGYRLKYREHQIGAVGHYWSSTPVDGIDRQAYAMSLDTTLINPNDTVSLEYSLSIRPVLDRK